jgi:diketogulonate reductase-like aldo/keto reductase
LEDRETNADTRNESMTNKPADVPTVTLGDELTVSAIGFGAMALTPVYGEVDDIESLATLHRCVDLGVTFIDTANVYGGGDSERLISRLLAVATTSPWPQSSASNQIRSTVR